MLVEPDGSVVLTGGTQAPVGGLTYSKTFPTSNGAYQRSIPSGADGAGFVSRFSADGTTLLASTLFNDNAAPFYNGVSQLAVDPAGSVHLLGSRSLAVLDGTLSKLTLSVPISSPTLLQVDQNGNAYVVATPSSNSALTKFSPAGKALFTVPIAAYPTASIVLDDGSIVLAGRTYQVNSRP